MRILLNDLSIELNRNIIIIPFKELETRGKTKCEISKEFNEFFLKRENSIVIDTFTQIININKCKCKNNLILSKNFWIFQ